MRRWKLVYFDDDQNQIEVLKEVLADRFRLEGTHDLEKFEEYLETNPDLVLIDVHMPVVSGYELYYKIQQSAYYNGCPMMFISGDTSPENELKSHLLGANDFLSRELELSELAARIVNKIKLYKGTSLKFAVDNLSIDLEMFCAYVDDEMVSLTLNELKILSIILRHFPKVYSRDAIISKVWGDELIKPGTVNAHLSVLNSKLKNWTYELKFKKDQVLVVKKDLAQ